MIADKKYFLATYGCQMNEYDSEVLSAFLEEMSYRRTPEPKEADLILFNTCCVREKADLKVYGKVGEFKEFKRERPELRIVVAGCLAQKDGEEMLRRFPQVDLVIGTFQLKRFPTLFMEVMRTGRRRAAVSEDLSIERLDARRESHVSAWVPVSFGCDHHCTFCIVPSVRGAQRSRPLSDILGDVQDLVQTGYKEINFLGQNVDTYGFDLRERVKLSDLLRRANDIVASTNPHGRIRFMTSHPVHFGEEIVQAVAQLPQVCEHIHIPLQAGSAAVLRAMKRGYTPERYLALAKGIRAAIPEGAISTDLIVGFPGETEDDFRATLAMVEEIGYDQAFMFAYSPRPGTAAAEMAHQVPDDVRKDRLNRLIRLQNGIVEKKNKSFVGQVLEVLVEGRSKKNPDRLMGRTRTNRLVVFEGEDSWIGEVVGVRILEGHIWGLRGECSGKAGSQGSHSSPQRHSEHGES
ncbi:MAG: tRNA (N6-isopentenyl adenosine(37)-C2)-methylthiotransferase MiaB [Armatimonadetes bacterium]|nr:tRNA (N6-isopentenyl adenosine(37)-C2)-methylthiotransferase MiaB [Armatimonadota bacterium]